MNHVFVAQEKNTSIVVVLYKKINKKVKITKNIPIEIIKFLFEFKISFK